MRTEESLKRIEIEVANEEDLEDKRTTISVVKLPRVFDIQHGRYSHEIGC